MSQSVPIPRPASGKRRQRNNSHHHHHHHHPDREMAAGTSPTATGSSYASSSGISGSYPSSELSSSSVGGGNLESYSPNSEYEGSGGGGGVGYGSAGFGSAGDGVGTLSKKPVRELPSPAERSGARRESLLGSSLAESEHTVVSLGNGSGPPRLIGCIRHSQGWSWNQELFLPSYADFDRHGFRTDYESVDDIVLTDEECAAMMPA
ncbi:hypothetical protein K431DRAFT_287643 [Polychaeton citri CBS 116435]|uniref:Uncharacterized protein n=1 Tax=Polychaeton citri CBS 116435 TaxID=1314669 RepID=A0A9P4Q2T5_9PEZI|nr:hypothetical protein K431DRAFT_287643 [Polychaeton citri CBS 116435]